MRRISNRLKGIAKLKKNDEHIADVRYYLIIWQYDEVMEAPEIEGNEEASGYMTVISGNLSATYYDVFTLELQDGSVWDVHATCEDSRGELFSITAKQAENPT